MGEVIWGPGGTSEEAVASLHARWRSPRPGAGPLLMAPTRAAFERARARITQPLDGVDVIIATSGSTDGTGRLVGLSRDAIEASGRATASRTAGPGQWLTSLPVHGIAGFQVVARSVLAGTVPVVHESGAGFDRALFEACLARLEPARPHYLSLVPTQLHRIVAEEPGLLAGFAAVLVGGAPLPDHLARRAADAGVRLVATYGSTETAGGCVYDGVPLDGVRVRIVAGTVQVGGATLATRYLDTPDQPFVTDADGRWLRTHDAARWDDGRLRVLGRTDDVLISGGANVNPHEVESALAVLAGQWVVVGVPDAEWGQRVVAVGTGDADLAAVRAATAHLAPPSRPRAVVHVDALPLRPTGKVDRLATGRLARSKVESRQTSEVKYPPG